jgi:hypothetical protein
MQAPPFSSPRDCVVIGVIGSTRRNGCSDSSPLEYGSFRVWVTGFLMKLYVFKGLVTEHKVSHWFYQ